VEGQHSCKISIPFTCEGVGRRRVSVGLMGMGEWEDAGHCEMTLCLAWEE